MEYFSVLSTVIFNTQLPDSIELKYSRKNKRKKDRLQKITRCRTHLRKIYKDQNNFKNEKRQSSKNIYRTMKLLYVQTSKTGGN